METGPQDLLTWLVVIGCGLLVGGFYVMGGYFAHIVIKSWHPEEEKRTKRSLLERLKGKWRVLYQLRIKRTYWKYSTIILRFLYLRMLNISPPNFYKVYEFRYNGFFGSHNKNRLMKYTAEFLEWTVDPGITRCKCSDGKERLIPTYALKSFKYYRHEEQKKTGVLFGAPSHS